MNVWGRKSYSINTITTSDDTHKCKTLCEFDAKQDMCDMSASVVFDPKLDDDLYQFLPQNITENEARQYLEEMCEGNFFEGVGGDDPEQVWRILEIEDDFGCKWSTVEDLCEL